MRRNDVAKVDEDALGCGCLLVSFALAVSMIVLAIGVASHMMR
jgi:hypothetical protein